MEYVSKQDAKSAFAQLSSTHFYGRRLVVDYAAERDGLEDLRAKSLRDMKSLHKSARRAEASTNGGGDKAAFDMEQYSQKADFT